METGSLGFRIPESKFEVLVTLSKDKWNRVVLLASETIRMKVNTKSHKVEQRTWVDLDVRSFVRSFD